MDISSNRAARRRIRKTMRQAAKNNNVSYSELLQGIEACRTATPLHVQRQARTPEELVLYGTSLAVSTGSKH